VSGRDLTAGCAADIFELSHSPGEGSTVAIASRLPYQFVDFLKDPGLSTKAGNVPLNQYMSKSIGNGGNDNTAALLGPLRWMRDETSGTILNSIVGGERLDILIKGQGRPDDFVKVMNFLCDNQDTLLKKIKLQVVHRPASNREQIAVEKSGTVYDLYFRDNRDVNALKMMVRDRFFGIDCIGFVANHLIYVGFWDKYYGREIDQWDQVFKKNVKAASEVQPLNILIWPGIHIAMVDWVWSVVDDKTVKVDICQSSSGGP
jgi:hypothetical protein